MLCEEQKRVAMMSELDTPVLHVAKQESVLRRYYKSPTKETRDQ